MNSYAYYKNARNAAWQCLLDNHIDRLPVSLSKIAQEKGIKLIRNSDIGILPPENSGVSVFDGEQWFVVYDEKDAVPRQRFTVAHEFGHIFLGHEYKNGYYNTRVFAVDKPRDETDADIFASRLLAPACVLWALDLHRAEDIAKVCNISLTAAQIRAERMEELYARNKFLTHPLERQVFLLFQEFINKNKPK